MNVIGDPSVDRKTVCDDTLSMGRDDGVCISERPLHNFYRIAHECACTIKEEALLQPAAAFDHASVMQPKYERMVGSRRLAGAVRRSHIASVLSRSWVCCLPFRPKKSAAEALIKRPDQKDPRGAVYFSGELLTFDISRMQAPIIDDELSTLIEALLPSD